jgi:hypothetical protein
MELQCARFQAGMALKPDFGKAQETYSMHVKLAYAVSVAAPVAMTAGRSKKSDGRAGGGAAALATTPASDVRVAGTGHAAPSTRRIAQLGNDKGNGAGLAIDEIYAHGLTIGAHPARRASVAGGNVRREAGDRGAVAARRVPVPLHFDSTKQRVAAADCVAARGPIRATDSGAGDGHFGTLAYDFKEANHTVLDVVTI